jgi:transmembrane sensor
MNDVIKLKTTGEIEEEAAAWVWRLDRDTLSATDRKGFEDWVRRDPRHRRAFEELGGVWSALDGLAEAKRAEKIATFAQLPGGSQHSPVRTSAWKILRYPIAATIVLSLAAFWGLRHGNEAQTLSTAVGQQRTVSLADGSTVYLNTNTIVETRLDREQRVMRLTKGEALFKVAPDKQRPFQVFAGRTVVRALGTEFNVRLQGADDVQVIVSEGRVEVESNSMSAPRIKLALSAGQRFAPAQRAPVVTVDNEALSKALAWRDGAIVFDGEPLGEAIVELNRYTDTRFIVQDPQVREMKVGGRFEAGDVDEFLAALKKALPVATRRGGDNLVYIEAEAR